MKRAIKLYAKNPDIQYVWSLVFEPRMKYIPGYGSETTMIQRLYQYIRNRKKFKTLILKNGKIHNTCGPAIIMKTKQGVIEEYWIDGKLANEQEIFNIKLKVICN